MGEALQIRVTAVTWNEDLLEKLWPKLTELAFSVPIKHEKHGVLEMVRALHEGLASAIQAAGLDLVHAAGPQMRQLYDILPPSLRGQWRETAAELAAEAASLVQPGDVVMVKGSNGSRAALVAAALAGLHDAARGSIEK